MKVILTDTFKKQLKKLDAAISKRVLDYLEQVELLDNRACPKNCVNGYVRISRLEPVCQIV